MRTSSTGMRPSERSAATCEALVGGDVVVIAAEHLRLEGEPQDAQQVEVHVLAGLAGRSFDEVGRDRAVLRADRRGRPAWGRPRALLADADSLDVGAGVALDDVELEALGPPAVLDAGGPQVVEHGLLEVGASGSFGGLGLADRLGAGAKARLRCGDRLSTVNGPVTRTLRLSSWGLS